MRIDPTAAKEESRRGGDHRGWGRGGVTRQILLRKKVRDGGGGHMASLIGILSCLLTHPTIVGPSIIYADMGKQSLTHLPTALPVPAKLCP